MRELHNRNTFTILSFGCSCIPFKIKFCIYARLAAYISGCLAMISINWNVPSDGKSKTSVCPPRVKSIVKLIWLIYASVSK
jgi:hypothetical protein